MLPRRLRDAGAFIGRQEECARLERAWEEARSASRLALIGGEPGIGKTRLAKRIAERAHRDGGVVLYGRCDEHLAIPYRPWAEVIAQSVEAATDAMLAAHVAQHGGAVARLAPVLARRVPELPERRPPAPRSSSICCSRRSPDSCTPRPASGRCWSSSTTSNGRIGRR